MKISPLRTARPHALYRRLVNASCLLFHGVFIYFVISNGTISITNNKLVLKVCVLSFITGLPLTYVTGAYLFLIGTADNEALSKI